MAARKEIREFDLLEFSRCLLRLPHLIPYSKPLEIQAAEQAIRLVLWKMFEKKVVPDAADVRDILMSGWRELREDTRGMRGVAVIVNRIRELITTVRVVSPVTHYVQKVGATSVTGDYAVLAPRDQKHVRDVFILRLRSQSEFPKDSPERTDVVNWARWLHLRFHEPSLDSIRVLNFGIDLDVQWAEEISLDENQVRAALTGLVNTVQSGGFFPVPSNHCATCLTMACMTRACRNKLTEAA
jgi:hypothetical protein